ncbi:MAG: carboxypeptidase-like regulatory domain-containing protein [Candidatus Acidiferrales bacterium]|jgi:hypothetical protein
MPPNSTKTGSCNNAVGGNAPILVLRPATLLWLTLGLLLCGYPALAQSQQSPDVPATAAAASAQPPDPQSPGSISGTVVDQTGDLVAGARVTLTREEQSPNQEVLSGDDGEFSFVQIAPGPFRLIVTADGFAAQTFSGVLHPGQADTVPQIALPLATVVTEVQVGLSRTEVAEEQIKAQEKQRVLHIVPNFYVSYVANAVPLTSKEKFQLAWKTTIDPVSFGMTAGIAGIQQGENHFSGYGQGAQGYAKRYGASYADFVGGTFVGSALLPSLLKQDPRYFYKGTGSKRSRVLYAMANSVICKGDNGHWQANYSSILGSLAAGGISNLYYPAKDRNGVGLTFENALLGIGEAAAANVLQEFLIRKLTPNARNRQAKS